MGFDAGKIRDWANENSAAVTIGAIVVMIASLAYMWFGNSGPSRSGSGVAPDVYYYDTGTKKFLVKSYNEYPPITTESGAQGFRAYIFGCGGCEGGGDLEGKTLEDLAAMNLFVGYFEGYTDEHKEKLKEAKAKAEAGDPSAMYYMEEGMGQGVMRSRDAEKWFPADHEESSKINREMGRRCPAGSKLKQCYPGR